MPRSVVTAQPPARVARWSEQTRSRARPGRLDVRSLTQHVRSPLSTAANAAAAAELPHSTIGNRLEAVNGRLPEAPWTSPKPVPMIGYEA
jgi:hypothetical protein